MDGDIKFYCGIGDTTFNHHPVYAGPYACVSPVTGRGGPRLDKNGEIMRDKKGEPLLRRQSTNSVVVPPEVQGVLLDSGAYSDTTFLRRTFEEALHRQLSHAEKYGYLDRVSDLVSYDLLVDEQANKNGERIKQRMDPSVASYAVEQTILAARYLSSQRQYIYSRVGHPVHLVFSAQGSDAQQYLKCAEAIIPFVQQGDVFGLGGWCILGRMHSLLPTFYETMTTLIPLLKQNKIKRVHIFGVCDADPLGALLWLCDHDENGRWDEKNRIQLSTDSVGPTTRVVKEDKKGSGLAKWGYASWIQRSYPVPHILDSCWQDACPPGTRCRGLERARHVAATREWLADFRVREPKHYRQVAVEPAIQMQRLVSKKKVKAKEQSPYQQISFWNVEAAS